MPTQTEQINDLINATTALKTTFENKDAAIDASVANVVADAADIASAKTSAEADAVLAAAARGQVEADQAAVDAIVADVNKRIPYRNLQTDGGRFLGVLPNPAVRILNDTPFTGFQDHRTGYNGAVLTDGGKYSYDTSTFGGTRDPLNQTVQDLFVAMGRIDASAQRYGPDFHIARVTAGSGTAIPFNGHYLMINSNGNTAFMSMYNQLSWAAWVRLVSGTGWVQAQYINGADESSREMTIAEGWKHIAGFGGSTSGYYFGGFPGIFGVPGTVFEIALPVLVPGAVQLPMHTQPLAPEAL